MRRLQRSIALLLLVPFTWGGAYGQDAAVKASPPKLIPLAPAYTDVTQTAYFNDSGDGVKQLARPTKIVQLTLHGSGFRVGDKRNTNFILINQVHEAVDWGSCQNQKYGTPNSPVPRKVSAEVVSEEEIRLCGIVVPTLGAIVLQVRTDAGDSETQTYRVFSMGKGTVTAISTLIALALALMPLWLLSFIVRGYTISAQDYKLRLLFLDPQTDTYSLSKLQFYLWTVAALFGYAYLFVSRVIVQHLDWPDVPAGLPGIIAVAAGTSIGSQVVTISRGPKGAGPVRPGFADLITSGGVVAPDRVQMLLWTLFGVGAFLAVVTQQYPGTLTDLPPIPDRLLYLMGLSSAGYLGGKLARKPGPVINEIAINPPDPDAAMAAKAALANARMPDFSACIADATTRSNAVARPLGPHAQNVFDAIAQAISATKSVQTPNDLGALWGLLGSSQTAAESAALTASADHANAPADASAAQAGAALLQGFIADVTQVVASTAAGSMDSIVTFASSARTITLRGTNLSTDGLLQIDHEELPFRMLRNSQGRQTPDVLIRDDTTPTFARVMTLTLEPMQLADSDLLQFHKWFGPAGTHTFTLINADGQQAEIMFDMPPVGTKAGAAS